MRKGIWLLWLLFATASVAFSSSNDLYLKSGDRVVFYGDSITDQRMYTMIVETYFITRYPDLNVTFVNSGWGGDTVGGGGGGTIDTRLQRDVFAYKPTVMTIMLGMNDGGYKAGSQENNEKYFSGYKHIVSTVRSTLPGIRITALEPSPYDDVTGPPSFPVGSDVLYNQVLVGYGKWIANYSKEAGIDVADLNTHMLWTLEKAKNLNPDGSKEIIPGHVHPSFAGTMIMAEDLLRSWGARPTVAAITIEASGAKPRATLSEHATLSDLSGGASISWTELDDALPLPFKQWEGMWGAGPVGLVIQSSDITSTLNQEPLKVTGLKSGVYSLKIDGEAVGAFNNGELASGINLALLKTPMTAQAMKVYESTVTRNDIHYASWRNIQVPLADLNLPEAQQTIDSMSSLESALIKKQHQIAQPKPHKFELTPIS